MEGTEFKKSKNCEAFTLVKDKEGKVNITLGNFIATKVKFNTFDQAERYIDSKPWELIINIIGISLNYEKLEKNAKKLAKESKKNTKSAENN